MNLSYFEICFCAVQCEDVLISVHSSIGKKQKNYISLLKFMES